MQPDVAIGILDDLPTGRPFVSRRDQLRLTGAPGGQGALAGHLATPATGALRVLRSGHTESFLQAITRATNVRSIIDVCITQTHERRLQNNALFDERQTGTVTTPSTATADATQTPTRVADASLHESDSREGTLEPPPYLGLIRGLVQRDQISEARRLLEALPSELEQPAVRRLRRLLAPPKINASVAVDTDRRLEYEWLRLHGQEYRGQWVAVAGGQLIASARTLKELLQTLRPLNLASRPLVHRLD
jgi:hypothetical protein